MTAPKFTTDDVRTALRAKYPADPSNLAPRSLLLEEVRNGTGFAANRSADALAFSFWPSDGLAIHGFEIKASRSDWLKELDQPEKAFAFARYCDFWTILAADASIVKDEELPPKWGLQVLNARGKLHIVRPADKNVAEPLPRAELMAILRNACQSTYEPLIAAHRKRDEERRKAMESSDDSYAKRELEKLRDKVKAFEDASGVKIDPWDETPERIGEIVRTVRNVLKRGYSGAEQTIVGHMRVLDGLSQQCAKALEEISALQAADVQQVGTP